MKPNISGSPNSSTPKKFGPSTKSFSFVQKKGESSSLH